MTKYSKTNDVKNESKPGIAYLEEIERGIQDKELLRLLDYRMGIDSARDQFLNYYLNYIVRIEAGIPFDAQMQASKGLNFKDFLDMLKKMIKEKPGHKVNILFISRNRKVKIQTTDGVLEGDYVFYSLMDRLSRGYSHIKFDLFIMDDLFKGYYYLNLIDIIIALNISFKKIVQWRYLKKEIIDRLNSNNCHHVASVASNFFQFKALLRSLLIGFSLRRMLDIYQPDVIIINDDNIGVRPECSSPAKVIIMQSARMTEYLEVCRRISFEEEGKRPDYFLASGEAFRVMKEWCHAAERIAVTGLPRYDILAYASEIYSRPDFMKKHGINPDKKIVLWLTQSHALSDQENARNFNAIFSAIKELQDTVLVIKQHPNEPSRYTKIIEKYILDYELESILMPKDSDTYELLYISDILILKNSTTAMEGIALGKPIIALNLSGQPDLVEYVREGVAKSITDGLLFKGALQELLKNDRELAANRQKYIEKYLYRIDGKATQRVLEIILNCLNEVKLKN